jgi:Ni/Fe-hydrogenase 1 B-type cytochrome subunit
MSHWLIAFSILLLSITGVYIGNPYLTPSGPANEQFVMATMKTVHFYAAIIFALTVATRIAWMFVGSYYARWHQFVPISRRRRGDVFGMLKFYTLISKEPPLNVGHNPLAGMTYLLVFALYLVMIFTGFALYSVSAVGYMQMWEFLLPIFGGAQMTRWIHHVAMWFILGFVAHHIWSAILISRSEGMGLGDSLLSGYKFLPKSWRNRDD